MKRNAVSTARGMGIVAIRTERTWSRNTMLTSVTTRASSMSARFRVWTARSIRSDRS